MHLSQLRAKLFRRVTSPIEILYDATTHWFVVLLILSLVTLFMVAKVTSEPPVYDCSATLVLSPRDISVDGERTRPVSREGEMVFISGQLSVLYSDAVLEALVKRIGVNDIIAQEEDPRSDDKVSMLTRFYRNVQGSLTGFLDRLEAPRPDTNDPERKAQAAMASFRKGANVSNDRRSNIVKLAIAGTRREGLEKILGYWIEAYRDRIKALSDETYVVLFSQQKPEWEKREQSAKEHLEKFKTDNPTVTPEQKKFLDDNLLRLAIRKEELKMQKDLGILPTTPGAAAAGEDEETTTLRKRIADLDADIIGMEQKVPSTNDKLREKKELREALQKSLQEHLGMVVKPTSPGADRKKPEEVADDQIALLDAEITKGRAQLIGIESKLTELSDLTADYNKASEMVRRYKNLADSRPDNDAIATLVDIKVTDPPSVSVVPREKKALQKIAGASIGGLLGGIFLAFLLEFVCRKVRYKRDIEDELGLKVVGVIPEN